MLSLKKEDERYNYNDDILALRQDAIIIYLIFMRLHIKILRNTLFLNKGVIIIK